MIQVKCERVVKKNSRWVGQQMMRMNSGNECRGVQPQYQCNDRAATTASNNSNCRNYRYSSYVDSNGCNVNDAATLRPGCPRITTVRSFISPVFWTRKAGPKKTTLVVVVVVVVISSLKIPKAFLIRSGAQRNFAHTFMPIFPTDLPAQIFSRRNAVISVIKVHFVLSI